MCAHLRAFANSKNAAAKNQYDTEWDPTPAIIIIAMSSTSLPALPSKRPTAETKKLWPQKKNEEDFLFLVEAIAFRMLSLRVRNIDTHTQLPVLTDKWIKCLRAFDACHSVKRFSCTLHMYKFMLFHFYISSDGIGTFTRASSKHLRLSFSGWLSAAIFMWTVCIDELSDETLWLVSHSMPR